MSQLIHKSPPHVTSPLSFTAAVGPCKLDGDENIIPITGDAGRVFSPQFPPGTPPRSKMCTWIITVPEGLFVRFSLISYNFDDISGNRNTTLEIRDGQNSSSDLLKLYSEWPYTNANEVFSSGRHLWVRFQSPKLDWSYMFRFSAIFEAVSQCKQGHSDIQGGVVKVKVDPFLARVKGTRKMQQPIS